MFALCRIPVMTALRLSNNDTKPTNKSILTTQKQKNIFYFEEISICQDKKNKLLIMNEFDHRY